MPELARLQPFWVYLSASPLLGLTLTLCAYVCAHWIYGRSRHSPLANPVAIAIALIALVLSAGGMSYERYFAGAQFVHFLLGPATVALAVPLVRQVPRLRRSFVPLACALLAGAVTGIASSIAIVVLAGASVCASTTPIAMAIAEKLGGIPSLTAVLVIVTGIVGSVVARFLFDLLRVRSTQARGFALGLAAHGIGTARAFQVSAEMGAFAGLGMGLNGVTTALLAPWLVPPLLRWLGAA
jgi:predicted murein hydrolase (TIGR00659 family)